MAQKGKMALPGGGFNVVGQGYQSERPGEGQPEAVSDDKVSVPTFAWSSQPNSPKDFAMVDQVMAVNRSLVQQIDALRMRLQVDSKHFNVTRSSLQHESDQKLKQKNCEIDDLKDELKDRESKVKSLTDENIKKRSEIDSLQHTINALKQDVEASKTYVDDIQHNLDILREEKDKLESGVAYREKEDMISRLNKEVSEMRANLSMLERELSKAKEVIATQGSKLRLLDHEKHNMHVKFKDELARATQTMRREVEKMREVMRGQWEEMRVLRQQNEGMRTDIKEIKDMLLGDPAAERQGPQYNMGALKPSLPALSNNRRVSASKKKPLG